MIAGKVTSKTGEPLAFANVYISDASGAPAGNIGVATDINGNYVLAAANTGLYVTASYVGYTRKTIQVSGQVMNFILDGGIELDVTDIVGKPINQNGGLLLIFALLGLATYMIRR